MVQPKRLSRAAYDSSAAFLFLTYSKIVTPINKIPNMLPSLAETGTISLLGRHGFCQANHYSDIRKYGDFGGEYHCDHSFEANPPAYTMLRMIRTPEAGGDTIFTSQTGLYDKLSPTFQKTFDGLHAIHSSEARHHASMTQMVGRRHLLTGDRPVLSTPSTMAISLSGALSAVNIRW